MFHVKKTEPCRGLMLVLLRADYGRTGLRRRIASQTEWATYLWTLEWDLLYVWPVSQPLSYQVTIPLSRVVATSLSLS
jgi:hypothetical protein